jgi:hypothetical protein
MPGFKPFLQAAGVEPDARATASALDDFENDTGLSLPRGVRDFFRACDGLTLDGGTMRLFSLDEARDYAESIRDAGIPQAWGYLPLTDTNDSNPYCVCCAAPLRNRVVRVYHDDVARLQFRSFENFLRSIRGVLVQQRRLQQEQRDDYDEDKGPSLYSLPSDFDPTESKRTKEDVAMGRALLQFADTLEGVARGDGLRFAITLLSSTQIATLARLLDSEDEYTREEVVSRLSQFQGKRARDVLRRYRGAVTRFVNRCAKVLRDADFQVEQTKGGIRLEPGPVWLNLPLFYTSRDLPDFEEQLVERARQLLSRK